MRRELIPHLRLPTDTESLNGVLITSLIPELSKWVMLLVHSEAHPVVQETYHLGLFLRLEHFQSFEPNILAAKDSIAQWEGNT